MRILCAMLLVMLGFAQKPIDASAAPLPVSANYVLPDGSVASLCLPGGVGEKHATVSGSCEVCRLVSGIVVPAAPADAVPVIAVVAVAGFVVAAALPSADIFPPNAPPRGPPMVSASTGAA